jgi:hypothetical protein
VALNPSAVPGTILNFSRFIWADRLLGHEVRNHARNPCVSVTPVTKAGVLFGRSPAGTAPASVVPAGMVSRDPDMSTDMRLLAASEERAGSVESEPVAVDLGCPLGCRGLVSPATTAAYAALPTVTLLPAGVGAPEVPGVSGAGRLAAEMIRPSEQENSAFLFPVMVA